MSPLRSLQRLFIVMTLGMAVLCFVLPWTTGDGVDVPSGALFYLPLILSVVSIAAVPVAGRLAALPRGLSGQAAYQKARNAYQLALMRRLFVVEVPALVGLAVSFSVDSVLPPLICGAVAVILMAVFVIPTAPRLLAAQRMLDRDGGSSELATMLG